MSEPAQPGDRPHAEVAVSIDTVLRSLRAGRTVEAAALAETLVARYPDRAPAWEALAACRHDSDAGAAAATRAQLLRPTSPHAMGVLYDRDRHVHPRRAVRHLLRALTVRPTDGALWQALAAVLRALPTAPPRSSPQRRPAILDPGRAQAWTLVGDWATGAGDADGAVCAYRRAAVLAPDDPGPVYSIAIVAPAAVPSELRDHIARRVENGALRDRSLELAAFALGLCDDHDGAVDPAFRWFAIGNAARRRQVPPLNDNNARLLELTLSAGLPVPRDREIRAGDPATPVFVVGLPGSGTTLLDSMLAMHPLVASAGELPYLARAAQAVPDYPRGLERVPADTLDSIAGEYLGAALGHVSDNPRLIVDKMPTNFGFVGLIRSLFPSAAILWLLRDPMAVGWSLFRRRFESGNTFAFGLADIADYIALHDRYLRHWRDRLPGAVLPVRFEALVGDPEGTLREVLAHLGLAWDPACLAFHRSGRRVATASAISVRNAPDRRRIDDWRRYEHHLEPLRQALRARGAIE